MGLGESIRRSRQSTVGDSRSSMLLMSLFASTATWQGIGNPKPPTRSSRRRGTAGSGGYDATGHPVRRAKPAGPDVPCPAGPKATLPFHRRSLNHERRTVPCTVRRLRARTGSCRRVQEWRIPKAERSGAFGADRLNPSEGSEAGLREARSASASPNRTCYCKAGSQARLRQNPD